MHQAEENGWTGKQTLEAADSIGFDWQASSIGGHFQDFVDKRDKG